MIKEKIVKEIGKKAIASSGFAGKKILISTLIGNIPNILFFYLIVVTVTIISGFFMIFTSLFTFNKSDPSTGLTYFEADTFYGLPYKANFDKNGDYNSIFKEIPSLYKDHKTFLNEKKEINKELQKILNETTFEDIIPNKCKHYCQNKLKDLYDVSLEIEDDKTYNGKPYEIYNASSGKKASFITLKFVTKPDNVERNMYYYETVDEDFDDSIITLSKDDDIKRKNFLFLKERQIATYYKYTNPYDKIREVNIDNKHYLENYYLSKSNIIGSIYKTRGFRDNAEILGRTVESFYAILQKNPKLKEKILNLIKKQIKYNSDQLVQSAIVDMLNFSGINEKGMTMKNSKSNQFLLSNERINLDYFNNTPFGKNYKQIIVKTKDFKDLDLEKAQKILKYKQDSVDEDSNEFGTVIPDDIIINVNTLATNNAESFIIKKKTNSFPIGKISDKRFYSPSITYKQITGGKSEYASGNTTCGVEYPKKQKKDYVIYNTETLYTGEQVRVKCVTTHKKGPDTIKYYDYKAPGLIQEGEVIFYKKFKFKTKVNRDSNRDPQDYYLNYFYQKEYINLDDNGIAKTTNKISDIYLDRKTIRFNGIYLRVRGFGIEIKGDGNLVTKKKSIDGYESLLPDAPVKFDIGLLTDINDKEIAEAKLFKGIALEPFKNDKLKTLQMGITGATNLRNPFFKNYNPPLYRKNKEYTAGSDVVIADRFYKSKGDLNKHNNIMLKIYLEREINKFKDSYFFSLVQNKKFFQILDDLYGLDKKNDEKEDVINSLKKYLVFFNDMDNNPEYQTTLLKKSKNIYPFKNFFNIHKNEDQFQFKFKGKQYYSKLFDKCYSYRFLNETYKDLYINEYSSLRNSYTKRFDDFVNKINKNKIEDDLLKSCYNTYLPYLSVNISVNTDKFLINKKSSTKKYYKNIIKDFGSDNFRTYILDEKLYKYLNDDNYIVTIDNQSKANEIYNMILAGTTKWESIKNATITDKDEFIKEKISKIFYDKDGLENLWEIYKNTDEYKQSCDEDKEVLLYGKEGIDENFKCSLKDVYNEFLDKLLKKKRYITFIKEEYLKQNIQDEPFYHYYNDSKLIYKKYIGSTGYETGFVPLEHGVFNPKSNISNHVDIDSPFALQDNEFILTQSDNTIAQDFTYSFDLAKTFSFNQENYDNNLGLHFVPLNPNLYLHSFFKNIKNGEKYKINVYGNGFVGLNQKYNKKEIEKEYITDLSNFILNKVTNKKVILDLIDLVNYNGQESIIGDQWWKGYFDETNTIFKLSKLFVNSSVLNNIDNYISNVAVGKDISKITHKNFNNSKISNYDLILENNEYVEEDNAGLHETSIIKRYWYSLYVLQLLQDHYNENNKDINVQLLDKNDSYEELMNTMKNINKNNDPIAKLYREVLMYAWGYLNRDDFTKLYFTDLNINMYGADSAKEYFETEPTELYEFTDTYEKFDDDELDLTEKQKENFEDALKKLQDEDFLDKLSKRNSKTILLGNGKSETLFGLDIKKEKVLNGELYYNDFNLFLALENKNTKKGYPYYYSVIGKQYNTLQILKKNYPSYYYEFYLRPILEDSELDNDQILKLKDFYDNKLLKEYGIETNISEYKVYINLVKFGLPKDNSDKYISIPYSKFKKTYEYKPVTKNGLSTGIDDLRKSFVNNNNVNHMPLYNMLSDLFILGDKHKNESIVQLKYKEKLLSDINLKEYYIKKKEKELDLQKERGKVENTKIEKVRKTIDRLIKEKELGKKGIENTNKLLNLGGYLYYRYLKNTSTAKLKLAQRELNKLEQKEYIKEINRLVGEINTLKQHIDVIQKEIDNLTEEEANKIIKYKVTIIGDTIRYDEIKENKDKTGNYTKALVFNGPFTPRNDIGFTIEGFEGSSIDNVMVKDLINSYIGFSFIVNNLKTTEDGIKKIVDELVLYSADNFNTKYKNFYDIENLGNFGNYYYNYDYVDPNNETDKLTFVLSGLEYGEGSLPGMQFDSDFSVVSIRDRLTKEILNKKFENLKTTYCSKKSTDEKKQVCVEYMSYLQTLSPSALDAELEYITLIYSMKKYTNVGLYNSHPRRYYYSTLANTIKKKEGKETGLSQYFDYLGKKNPNRLGQCTWYVGVLKRTQNGDGPALQGGNGVNVAGAYGRAGYPTDTFNPKTESVEKILRKIEVGDVISFKGRNFRNGCVHYYDGKNIDGVGHVAVVIGKNENKGTITLGEANIGGTFRVKRTEKSVKKLCSGTVAHGVPWAY